MTKAALGTGAMDRKIISITGKRQITIPLKFYEKLGLVLLKKMHLLFVPYHKTVENFR